MDRTAILKQLERILASERFAGSERLCAILRYVVERSVESRPETIKEYAIATEVLGSAPDYNPQVDSTVRSHVSRLRTKLVEYYAQEGAHDPIVIRLPKGSYVPEFDVRAPEAAPFPAQEALGRSRSNWRRWWLVGGAVVLAGVGLVAALVLGGVGAGARRGEKESSVQTIGVLPFAEFAGGENDGQTAAMVSNKVAAKLSESQTRIVGGARTASLQYRSLDLKKAGRQLGVDAVLTGSVQRSGDRLVVTAQLTGVADGVQIWAGVFERSGQDHLRMEGEISDEIARSLLERIRVNRPRPAERNPKAMALYLQGVELIAGDAWASAWNEDQGRRFNQAIRLFEEAIQEAPRMAAAWVELADTQRRISILQPGAPLDWMDRARRSVERALEMDPMSARGRWLRARIAMFHDYDLAAAEPDFRRAIELNPFEGDALMEYADLLFLSGREKEAVFEVSRALEMNPMLPQFHIALGLYHAYAGNLGQGVMEADRALRIDSRLAVGLWLKARCLAGQGARHEAEAALRQAIEAAPNDRRIQAHAVYWYARTGRAEEARRIIEEMANSGQRGRNAHYVQALAAAAQGKRDEAIRHLERSRERHEASFVYLPIEERFLSLSNDGRFARLAGSIRGAKIRGADSRS